MTKFEEDLKNLKVSKSENDTEYYSKAQLLTAFKDWQPHQALPVVPKYVAEFIEESKGNLSLYGALFFISDNTNKKLNNWVFREANQNLFARAWLDGYTVEKPQLFYLKNKLTTSYLILDTNTRYFEHWGSTEATGRYKSSFTQQEIDSMETGSYEQIEVEDE